MSDSEMIDNLCMQYNFPRVQILSALEKLGNWDEVIHACMLADFSEMELDLAVQDLCMSRL